MRSQRAEYDATRPAGASAAARWWPLILTAKMPIPSRKARDGMAATKPVSLVGNGFVEVARILGGQPFAPFRSKLRNCRHARRNVVPLNQDAVFSARSCAPRRLSRFRRESRKSSAPGGDARCDETGRKRRWKPP